MKNILIIQTAFLGDVILATALAETLYHKYQDANIDFLINKKNSSLLEAHPFIKKILLFDKQSGKIREIFRLLKIIRHRKYDAVINVHRFMSSGILTAFSKAPVRSGYKKNPLSMFFTHRCDHHYENIHETERNLQLISFTGIDKTLLPKLYLSADIIKSTEKYKTRKYICIAPASVWFTKQFPDSKWIELINSLPEDLTIYLLGAPDDIEVCKKISSHSVHKNVIVLSGKLTLLQTASLMKDAVMNYVNDSAPLHITSAVNSPVTAIFCSTLPSFGFGPLSSDALIVETLKTLKCRPCGIHGLSSCQLKHFDCAFSIDTEILSNRTIQKLKPAQLYD